MDTQQLLRSSSFVGAIGVCIGTCTGVFASECSHEDHWRQLSKLQQNCAVYADFSVKTIKKTVYDKRTRESAMPDLKVAAICNPQIPCNAPRVTVHQALANIHSYAVRVGGSASASFKAQVEASLVELVGVELGAEHTVSASGDITITRIVQSSTTLDVTQWDCHNIIVKTYKTTRKVKIDTCWVSECRYTMGNPFTTPSGQTYNCVSGDIVLTKCDLGCAQGDAEVIDGVEVTNEFEDCCSPLHPPSPAQPCCARICPH